MIIIVSCVVLRPQEKKMLVMCRPSVYTTRAARKICLTMAAIEHATFGTLAYNALPREQRGQILELSFSTCPVWV